MSNEVKKTLRDLYLKEGSGLFSDSLKLNSYINDMLYAYRVEKNVLSTVVRGGYVSKILSEVKTEKDFSKAQFYVDQIVSQHGISKENASDAVDAIIYAIHGKESNVPAESKGTVSGGSGSFIGDSTTGTSGKIDIPTPIEAPPNNFLTRGSSASNQNKTMCLWIIVAIIGIAVVAASVIGSNSNKTDTTSSTTDTLNDETITQETKYVVDTQLNSLPYLKKDDEVTVGNGNISSNIGTSYAGYIKSEFPYSDVTYALNGNYDTFQATWAITDSGKNTKEYSSFEILADGTSVYVSPRITSGDTPVNIDINTGYCDSISIVFKEGDGDAFIGNPILSSSQSERIYSNTTSNEIKTSKWLTELDEMTNEKMIVWKDTWIKTNTGTCLSNTIEPYVPSYSNVDVEKFAKNGSYMDYYLGGEYSELSGTCAIDGKNKTLKGNMTIQCLMDDKVVYTSPVMSKDSHPADFNIDVSGCQKLRIKFIPSGDGNWGYDASGFNVGNLKLYK